MLNTSATLSVRPGTSTEFVALAEPHRHELMVHCYRMLGSSLDAEDLVQETFLRAWQRLDTYQGRASFRAWLYKIATNLCLDVLERRPKRVLPRQAFPAANPSLPPAPQRPEPIWLEPLPDDYLASAESNPEARYSTRESITLAFLAALQVLPPRQRAVLVLRDVLDWEAREASELLGMTISAVNSALHRARLTLTKHYRRTDLSTLSTAPESPAARALLERYLHAWQAAQVGEMLALLKEEAALEMPPSLSWYRGRVEIAGFFQRFVLGAPDQDLWRLLPIRANGCPAVAWYLRGEEGIFSAFAIQVLEFEGNQLAVVSTFAMPKLFALFRLPEIVI